MRILILRQIEKNSMDDIFNRTDYSCYEWIKATNVGNKLWLMGIVSIISTPENQVDFLQDDMDADYINANYDICIKPEANIFSARFREGMERHVERYKNVRIPIYVIACGAAAKSYDELDELCAAIREPATGFIRSVYRTGGEFCLRGYFTKELFERLGFHDAVVTGCPSLFQMGRNLKISDAKVSPEHFKAALNGSFGLVENAMKRNPGSVFIDQGLFYPLMYADTYVQSDQNSIKWYGAFGLNRLREERVKLWIDMQDWADYLLTEHVSFSSGSRIHGNILPLLCGIPAAICPLDARVREMAEFYEIPMISETDLRKRDLYEIYCETSYMDFNRNFAAKFDAYEAFLKERGIVKEANAKPILHVDKVGADTDRLTEIRNSIHMERICALCDRVNSNPVLLAYDTARKFAIAALERSSAPKYRGR